MWLLSGTALWYSTLWGDAPLPVRWVLVRDSTKKYKTWAYFSTDQLQNPAEIVSDFAKRWNSVLDRLTFAARIDLVRYKLCNVEFSRCSNWLRITPTRAVFYRPLPQMFSTNSGCRATDFIFERNEPAWKS
jgi:hypothetical protein